MSFRQSVTTKNLMSEEKENIQFQLTDELIEKVEQLIEANNGKELQQFLSEFHYADIAEILDELDQDDGDEDEEYDSDEEDSTAPPMALYIGEGGCIGTLDVRYVYCVSSGGRCFT